MAGGPRSVFLERENYRRRRTADAACLAPVFGVVLLVLPALWAGESRTAQAMIYVFSVWALLILLMAVVSRKLSAAPPSEQDDASDRDGEP